MTILIKLSTCTLIFHFDGTERINKEEISDLYFALYIV